MSRDVALEKGLPASLEYERLVLGALLTGAEYQLVAGIVQAKDFSRESHQLIFLRMGDLYKAGHPISVHSVALELQRHGQLDTCRHGAVGGTSYLADLTDGLPDLTGLDYYCQVIKDKSILRRVMFGSQGVIDRCLAGQDSPREILAVANDMIRGVEGQGATKGTLLSFGEILENQGGLNSYASVREPGIETPWPSLNRIIGGFRTGQMITIAGLTGSGKSAAALQIAEHAARTRNIGVALFSLEMTGPEIFERAACSRAGIDSKKLERGTLSEEERHRFARAAAELTKLPLWIDDTTSCTLPSMHLALRRHIQKHAIGLLIIDYLQLMQTIGRSDNRTREVSEISRGMKLAAREFNIPVIVLAQLNRSPATQQREPQLHDLRESGSIEHDSDKVLFLHPKPNATQDGVLPVSLIVAKQRNGRSRKYINLLFLERYTRFEEQEKDASYVT